MAEHGHQRTALMYLLLISCHHCVGHAAMQPDGTQKTTGKNSGEHDKAHSDEQVSTTTSRKWFYGFAISGTLFFGYFWNQCWSELPAGSLKKLVPGIFTLLHGPAQFLPIFAASTGVPWLTQHQAGCNYGLPWEWHLTYAVVVTAAMPILSASVHEGLSTMGSVPILGLSGTPFNIYNYVSTLLVAFDQYSDSAGASLALACGWDKAYLMVAILFIAHVLQVVAAGKKSRVHTSRSSTVWLQCRSMGPCESKVKR